MSVATDVFKDTIANIIRDTVNTEDIYFNGRLVASGIFRFDHKDVGDVSAPEPMISIPIADIDLFKKDQTIYINDKSYKVKEKKIDHSTAVCDMTLSVETSKLKNSRRRR